MDCSKKHSVPPREAKTAPQSQHMGALKKGAYTAPGKKNSANSRAILEPRPSPRRAHSRTTSISRGKSTPARPQTKKPQLWQFLRTWHRGQCPTRVQLPRLLGRTNHARRTKRTQHTGHSSNQEGSCNPRQGTVPSGEAQDCPEGSRSALFRPERTSLSSCKKNGRTR